MNFLNKLFGKKQRSTVSSSQDNAITITLWSRDEAAAQELATDKFFLMGILSRGSSTEGSTKTFLDALSKGNSLSHKISSNSTKGGYDVELTILLDTDPISKRFSNCAERLGNLINERERFFILPQERGIENRFLDGKILSHEIIHQDLSKFLTGLRGQAEAWSTGRFQGQVVRKDQLLSGLQPLLRDWDQLLSAWHLYSIGGDGLDRLKSLYDDITLISIDSQKAPFPN